MSKELLQGLGSIIPNGSSIQLVNNEYLLFTGNVGYNSAVQYIPIADPTHTFEYDITFESDAGNYFYIGIERYDINKATGSNSCCIYQISTSNTAKSKQRVRGTVNLNQAISSSNTNKTAYIRLRMLNQWSGSSGTNVTAKIYHLSLREITEITNKISITKTGQLKTDDIWENFNPASFNKLNVIESNNLYEY